MKLNDKPKEEVPLPNSSITNNEFFVESFNICDICRQSIINEPLYKNYYLFFIS